jgi:hypothetical protein
MHADTDFAQAETQPVTPPPTARADATTRFEAATRGGTVALQLDGPPAAHAAEAALLLDHCDDLLDALDAWLHMALDWRWVEPGASGAALPPGAHATCAIAQDEPSLRALVACIEWPWALLRSVGAPPEALARELHWRAVPALLVASQPAIDEAELRLLEVGGAVVLPESMRTPWRGCLRAADETAGAGVVVELPAADTARLPEVRASHAAGAAPRERPPCEIRLAATGPLAPAQLAGWAVGSTVDLAARASLWHCAGPTDSERHLAGGRLLPWGDGWAMLVESV